MKKLFIDSDKRKKPLKVGGFDITVLASTHDTMGYEIFVQKGQEGKGPGPHFPPWDETFYILNGKLHCGIDEDEFVALPGTLVHIPGGKTHWFKFGVGGAEFLAITSKGNASEMFTEFDKGINWANPDKNKLVELAAQYNQTVITNK